MDLTYTTAFLAGMISFLSPCVLPLVPGFVGTMTGLSAEQLQEDATWHWRTILFNAVLFALGFSVLFISLGASAGTLGRFLSAYREWVNRLAGVGIVFFGLVLLGWLPFRFLHRDVRFQREIRRGKLRSFSLGLAFAFGWTPCAGPVLVAMLMMAATHESVWQGTRLLAVYSAGFAIPFIAVALSLSRFLIAFQRFRRQLLWVERFGGVMLVSVGVLLFFDKLADLAFYLTRFNHLLTW
jgi:cytochrome c-type biogenesis protein